MLAPFNIAQAQGTTAGTLIANKVVVTYVVDGSIQTPIESSPTGNNAPGVGNGESTLFKVDRKIDLSVTSSNDVEVTPGDMQSELTFTLLNEGNDTQTFNLATNSTLTGDSFDSSQCSSTVTSVTGTLLPNIDLPTIGSIKLSADQSATVSVKCNIPFVNTGGAAIQTGDSSLVSLSATAVKNDDDSAVNEETTADDVDGVETVFADNAGSDDADRDASHSARRSYLVTNVGTAPSLSLDKSVISITDPSGGNTAISGAEVSYKIKVLSAGSGFINHVVITDPTPAGMNYKLATIKLDGVSQTDANDAVDSTNFGASTANTATIDLGNIAAGSQHEIQITYIIN